MSNDDVLAEAVRLIKSGQKDAARAILEPLLQRNPNNVQAWIWEAELFSSDSDKIKVLENCLKNNPGNSQVIQALNFLKSRATPSSSPSKPAKPFSVSPFTTSPFEDSASPSSFTNTPPVKPPPPVKPAPPFSTSPFTTTSPFVTDDSPSPLDSQKKQPPPSLPPAESAAPGQAVPPEKKTAQKRSKKKDALIFAGVFVVFLLLVIGYAVAGFYSNSQIKKSFAAQNCEAVVGHSAFSVLYPKGIFSNIFEGHDQYTQCSLKLDVEQTVAAKNWGAAYSLTREYLTLYPQGVFAEEMHKQSVETLSTWGKGLIADGNYGDGIEKLQTLTAAYPSDSVVPAMQDEIQQAYLDWSQVLRDGQSYADAEQKMQAALVYFGSDARAEKIKEELVNVYVGWGDSQIEIGNIDNALGYYQKAGEASQGKADIDLLIAKAYLKQAVETARKNDFEKALAKVKEIGDAAKSEKVTTEVNAAQKEIFALYSASNSQQAMDAIAESSSLICNGQSSPTLPIFGVNKDNTRFSFINSLGLPLPSGWAAETPGELHYVACAVETETEVETCSFNKGRNAVIRLRYDWALKLYNAASGEEYASQILEGSEPAKCKAKESFGGGIVEKKSYGNRPTVEQVVAWLESLNLRK